MKAENEWHYFSLKPFRLQILLCGLFTTQTAKILLGCLPIKKPKNNSNYIVTVVASLLKNAVVKKNCFV